MKDLIEKLNKLYKRVTPGDWNSENEQNPDGTAYQYIEDQDGKVICDTANSELVVLEEDHDCDGTTRWDETGRRNFEFICELKNCFPFLMAYIKVLEEHRHSSFVE